MKKGSNFEKFYKGREKSGGAKKEEFRQEKRKEKKEREEKIIAIKREKRAKNKASSSMQPPKYNLEPPGQRFQKAKRNDREEPSYRGEKKKFEINPKRTNKTTKPEKWDGPRPSRDNNPRPYKADNTKPYHPKGQKPYSTDKSKQYQTGDQKPHRTSGQKPVLQKKEEPKKVGYKDKAGDLLRQEPKTPINRQHTEEELMPLNKYIAHSGVCSRRDAVDLIKGGKVKVNGELVLEPGHKVAVSDDVKVAGKKLNPVKDFIYILLNKPKDYITTTDDPQQRRTVFDLLKGAPDVRIYPVGRLDRNTSGVLLLTNDGDLSQKLTHPSNEIKKVYAVTLDKPLTKHHFEDILKGVPLEDGIAYVDSLAFPDAKDLTQVGIELHSGRNRIVRRIFEHFGYDVKALDRVIFAGLTKKNITRGKWRYLSEREVRDLKFFKRGRK